MKKLVVLIGFFYLITTAHSAVYFCKLIKTNIDSFSPNGRPVFGYINFDEDKDYLGLSLLEDETRNPQAKTMNRKCYDILNGSQKYKYYSCEVDDEWRWGDVVGKMRIDYSRFQYPKDTFLMTFEDSAVGSTHYDFKTRENTFRQFYCKKN